MNKDNEPAGDPTEADVEAPVDYPVDGILDLHTFQPREVRDLVPNYIDECQRIGIQNIRIIHGKGTGQLRSIVQSILAKHPGVISFRTANDSSGWGATLVRLETAASGEEETSSTGNRPERA